MPWVDRGRASLGFVHSTSGSDPRFQPGSCPGPCGTGPRLSRSRSCRVYAAVGQAPRVLVYGGALTSFTFCPRGGLSGDGAVRTRAPASRHALGVRVEVRGPLRRDCGPRAHADHNVVGRPWPRQPRVRAFNERLRPAFPAGIVPRPLWDWAASLEVALVAGLCRGGSGTSGARVWRDAHFVHVLSARWIELRRRSQNASASESSRRACAGGGAWTPAAGSGPRAHADQNAAGRPWPRQPRVRAFNERLTPAFPAGIVPRPLWDWAASLEVALVPGICRSGPTISGARVWRGAHFVHVLIVVTALRPTASPRESAPGDEGTRAAPGIPRVAKRGPWAFRLPRTSGASEPRRRPGVRLR